MAVLYLDYRHELLPYIADLVIHVVLGNRNLLPSGSQVLGLSMTVNPANSVLTLGHVLGKL